MRCKDLKRTIRITIWNLKCRTTFGTHGWGPVSTYEALAPPITYVSPETVLQGPTCVFVNVSVMCANMLQQG